MKKTRILVLEDDPERHKAFKNRFAELQSDATYTIVETAQDCESLLKSEEYELIFLDHDLGGKVFVDSKDLNTGAAVARWIAKNKESILGDPIFIVHSLNPDGSEYMRQTISEVFSEVYRMPFVWEENEFHKRIKLPNG